jgi:hypothetical protein
MTKKNNTQSYIEYCNCYEYFDDLIFLKRERLIFLDIINRKLCLFEESVFYLNWRDNIFHFVFRYLARFAKYTSGKKKLYITKKPIKDQYQNKIY